MSRNEKRRRQMGQASLGASPNPNGVKRLRFTRPRQPLYRHHLSPARPAGCGMPSMPSFTHACAERDAGHVVVLRPSQAWVSRNRGNISHSRFPAPARRLHRSMQLSGAGVHRLTGSYCWIIIRLSVCSSTRPVGCCVPPPL